MALYHKYRPTIFGEVIGQEHVTRTLKNSVVSGSLVHAYLFVGTRGIGKTTVARILARAFNCQNLQQGEPCNKCEACTAILTNRTADIVEVDAASNRGIDDITVMLERAKFSPMSLDKKVYILDEVHQLTPAAKDALLKTLEEPPNHAVFILATTEDHKVPDTIRSRCQKFDFKKADTDVITTYLKRVASAEDIPYETDALKLLGSRAAGSFRDGVTLLENVAAWDSSITIEHVREVLGIPLPSLLKKTVRYVCSGNQKALLAETSERNLACDATVFMEELSKMFLYIIKAAILNNKQKVLGIPVDTLTDTLQRMLSKWETFSCVQSPIALEVVLLDAAGYIQNLTHVD